MASQLRGATAPQYIPPTADETRGIASGYVALSRASPMNLSQEGPTKVRLYGKFAACDPVQDDLPLRDLTHLTHNRSLEILELNGSWYPVDLKPLVECKLLKEVSLEYLPKLGDDSVAYLCQVPSLTFVRLHECRSLTEKFLIALATSKTLPTLEINFSFCEQFGRELGRLKGSSVKTLRIIGPDWPSKNRDVLQELMASRIAVELTISQGWQKIP